MPKAKKTAATDEERINALKEAATDVVGGTEEDEELEAQGIEGEETEEQEVEESEETREETEEEVDEEGLPKKQKSRSELGRKIAAVLRRQDEFDQKFDQLITAMTQQVQQTNDAGAGEIDPDEPLTRSELDKLLEERESRKTQSEQRYQDNYLKGLAEFSADLDQVEVDAIIEELKVITYTQTNDPKRDAESNWLKAERAYLRKHFASGKQTPENPLKGNKPRSALGTTTQQKVIKKEASLPKLDAFAKKYIDFVRTERGDEAATKLHQGLGRND